MKDTKNTTTNNLIHKFDVMHAEIKSIYDVHAKILSNLKWNRAQMLTNNTFSSDAEMHMLDEYINSVASILSDINIKILAPHADGIPDNNPDKPVITIVKGNYDKVNIDMPCGEMIVAVHKNDITVTTHADGNEDMVMKMMAANQLRISLISLPKIV